MKSLKEQIQDAEKQIEEYDKSISKIREKQSKLAKKMEIEKSKEFSAHIKDIIPIIDKMILVLKKYKYPKDSACSHFGVDVFTEQFKIFLSSTGPRNSLQVVIETNNEWVLHHQMGLTKNDWIVIYKMLNKKYGIEDKWNGDNEQRTGTFILKIFAPVSLVVGIKNYVAFRPCEFNYLFEENYKR